MLILDHDRKCQSILVGERFRDHPRKSSLLSFGLISPLHFSGKIFLYHDGNGTPPC